ncbi:MAG: hypothetical protein K0R51_2822 [Cytophagaceae bacterium]|jgi:hypothetical protein|nr:hypothetical protein [Cytophagaceae bacterium]
MKEYAYKIAFFNILAISLVMVSDGFSQKVKPTAFSYASHVPAADHKALQDKYWFYRHRLKTEFLKIGTAPIGQPSGYGIPACQAYKAKDDMLHFGDGTSFLGNYIGVLATEYLLLSRSGASADELNLLKEELYSAMKAYERLDYNAEIIVPPHKDTSTAVLNGFFLRDDIDVNTYLTDFTTPQDPAGELKTLVSDYSAAKDSDPCDSDALRFPTVDQISNLLVGFALVVKCMGEETYQASAELYPFKEKAKAYTHTIMTYMKEVNYLIKHPTEGCAVRYNEGGYLLAYGLAHAAQAIVEERFGLDPMVKVGFDKNNFTAYESSNTFLSSAVWQNNINYPQGKDYFRQNFEALDDDRNGIMRFTDAVIGSGGLYGYTDAHDYNNAIVAQTAAISNVLRIGAIPYTQKVKIWGKTIPLTCYDGNIPQYFIGALGSYTHRFPFLKAISQIATAVPILSVPCDGCLPELSVNTTSIALSAYGDIADIQYFATLHQFLHGSGIYNYDHQFLLMLLKEAPASGPHYQPYRDPNNPPANNDWNSRSESEGSPWWRQDNRWEKSSRTHAPDQGAWNGLDYMIAYNMFLLVNDRYYDMPAISMEVYKSTYFDHRTTVVSNSIKTNDLVVCYKETVAPLPIFQVQPVVLSSKEWHPVYRRVKLKYSLALFWHPVL